MRKKKIYLISGYIILSILTFFYIRNVLRTEEIKTFSKEKKEESLNEYEVNVTLKYYNGRKTTQYIRKITNTDSLLSLLQDVRNKEDLPIEFNEYTYGIEIISVENVEPNEGYKWALLNNGDDITLNIASLTLEKDTILELKMLEE